MAYTGSIGPSSSDTHICGGTLGGVTRRWGKVTSLQFNYDDNAHLAYNPTATAWEMTGGGNTFTLDGHFTGDGAPTAPPVAVGLTYIDTTGGAVYVSTGITVVGDWKQCDGSGGGGVTDHGALTGRDDDDHTQYCLTDGSRGFTLGTDATGDMYYRPVAGGVDRLGVGTDGQVLTLAAGLPTWADAAGGGGNYVATDTDTDVSANTEWQDGFRAQFGNGGELSLRHETGNSYLVSDAGNINVTNSATNGLFTLRTQGSVQYQSLVVDPSRPALTIPDTHTFEMGATATSFQVFKTLLNPLAWHIEGNHGDLLFKNNANDKYIRYFVSDISSNEREALTISPSGNVGIGTNSPGQALSITRSTEDATIIIERSDNVVKAQMSVRDDKAMFGTRTNHQLNLSVNNQPKVYIDTSGNVSIEGLKSAKTHPASYRAVYVNTETGELYRLS